MSRAPATTCAAVTTRSGPANQPLPSTPTPQAVPSTLTTRALACLIDRSRRTPALGGSVGALGPAIDGNGSMRASRLSRVRGGSAALSCLTIAERSTWERNPVSPGVSSATEDPTQTIASPMATPSRSPPAESSTRSGLSRSPPRTKEPAKSAPI